MSHLPTYILSFCLLILFSCQSSQETPQAEPFSSKVEHYALSDAGQQSLPFSDAVRVGNILYLSGKLGTTTGKNLKEGGIQAETQQTMENIKATLEQYGSSMDQVIKCTCMLADIEEWPAMNEVYVTYFTKHKPARSAFATNGLALGARVEIECMAWVD